jgi:LmbE family N-acetylglucosaminyl deacetylase
MTDFYAHVYLSPHLDDAALSCGGLIHQQVMAGQRPLVITLFAGRPPTDVELSAFAQSQHARWGDPGDIVATRWAEDQAALAALGADYLRLDYPDCIYRGQGHTSEPVPNGGPRWFYTSEEAIFGRAHPAEEALPAELADTLTEFIPPGDGVTLYAPLTVGNHVDHQLAFAAALFLKAQGWQIRLYEDYPYAETEGAVSEALAAQGVGHWQMMTVPLADDDLTAKVEAIACYASQLDTLFDSPEAMPGRVRSYAARIGGERLWQPG